MKKILLILAVILLAGSAPASIVPLEKAEKAALSFYYQKYNQFEGMITIGELSVTSTYTEFENGIPYYHVFHFNQGGFVVVSAEDLLNPVIAYSFKNNFDVKLQGYASCGLMQHYKDMISFVREQNEAQRPGVSAAWKTYLSDDLPSLGHPKDWGSMGPLLTTEWDQGWPYNYYCPETGGGGSAGHAWAGCMANATQQIMAYYRWPDHGQGSTSYIPENHPEYGVQFADFENKWYRWEEMPDNPQTVNLAIAENLYHIGVSFHMNYDTWGSPPGYPGYGQDSSCYFFKYIPYYPEHLYYRDSITYETWINILKSNIDRQLPVFYSGGDYSGVGRHAFVCDGYQDSAYFHFNFGLSGSGDGFYHIDSLPIYWNYYQNILVERYPDTVNFTYPLYPSGADTLKYVEGSIEDGSGPVQNYLNNHNASWLIDPQDDEDSVTNIEIVLKRFELFEDEDRVYIYDGNDNTDPLLAEFSGQLMSDSVISTSGNQAFVEFITDGNNTANGFYLSYYCNQPVWCNGTTQIIIPGGTIDDGSGDFFYDNDKDCTWEIDPAGICPYLELEFNYFMTEDSADILFVYDLETNDLLAELSGEYITPPPPVISSNGKIKLVFKTNNSVQNEGWEVYYHPVNVEELFHPLYSQVRPNPASEQFMLAFTLYDRKTVRIELFDVAGNRISVLKEASLAPGTYDLLFNIECLEAGMYFCRIQAGEQVETKKVVKIRD
jgi:hypothetical protein